MKEMFRYTWNNQITQKHQRGEKWIQWESNKREGEKEKESEREQSQAEKTNNQYLPHCLDTDLRPVTHVIH